MISVLSGNQFLSGFFAAIYPNIRELNLLDPMAIVRSNAEFCPLINIFGLKANLTLGEEWLKLRASAQNCRLRPILAV
jgi:hypothetical protein